MEEDGEEVVVEGGEGEGDMLIPATPPAFLLSATATRLPSWVRPMAPTTLPKYPELKVAWPRLSSHSSTSGENPV